MISTKSLFVNILSWIRDWAPVIEKGVNNTTDTWVPVWSSASDGSGRPAIQHRKIPRNIMTTQQVTATINKAGGSVAISAPSVSEYTFVCWLQPATVGWIGYPYVENPALSSTKVWQAANTGKSGDGTVRATALYKANF